MKYKSIEKIITKAQTDLSARAKTLKDKKVKLREQINERYPADAYGIKGEMIYEEKVWEINAELNSILRWSGALREVVEAMEKRGE